MAAAATDLTPQPLRSDDLNELAAITSTPCVSIYLRTHRAGKETLESRTRLKNLVKEARQQLDAAGHDHSLLAKIESLQHQSEFWQHQSDGLAIFLAEDQVRLIQLDQPVDDRVVVADSLFVLPLIVNQPRLGQQLVLVLTWDQASLFRRNADSLEPVSTEHLPGKFDELVLPRDPEESLQNTTHRAVGNSATSSTAMFHGQGEGEGKIEADRRKYLTIVSQDVAGEIYRSKLPLTVVATKEVVGHLNSIDQVKPEMTIEASAAHWSDAELKKHLREAMKSQEADHESLVDRAGTALAQHQGSSDEAEVLEAARSGRVDSLLVCEATENAVQVNEIVVETLRRRGDVVVTSHDQMPRESSIAAIYRY